MSYDFAPVLAECVFDATTEYRKGEATEVRNVGDVAVMHIYNMDHESEAPDGLEMVDVNFIQIGVDKERAEAVRKQFIEALDEYPEPDRLAGGPTYIEFGARVGSQDIALRAFALGKILDLWDVITPATFGFEGAEAEELAGRGFVLITGYKKGGENK